MVPAWEMLWSSCSLLPPVSNLPSRLCSLRPTSWDSFIRVPLLAIPDSPTGGPKSGQRQKTVVTKAAYPDRVCMSYRSTGNTGVSGADGETGSWKARGLGVWARNVVCHSSKHRDCCTPFQFYKAQALSHCSHKTVMLRPEGEFRMEKNRTCFVLWILVLDS